MDVGRVVAGNLKGGGERIGDWLKVRELCDFGERMVIGLACWMGDFKAGPRVDRVVAGDEGMPDCMVVMFAGGFGLDRFFGLSRAGLFGCEFSLSEAGWNSSLLFMVRAR